MLCLSPQVRTGSSTLPKKLAVTFLIPLVEDTGWQGERSLWRQYGYYF
jgi:hypothetical protein